MRRSAIGAYAPATKQLRGPLSGGSGANHLAGELDADLYISSNATSGDTVSDHGGVDRLDVRYVSYENAIVSRVYNDLLIRGGGHIVRVQRFFTPEGRIEQIIFADGTYAASAIEYLLTGGTGDGEHTARPIVLDLDGDGFHLVGPASSKARFDVDGDGDRERIGWMEPDDGMLVLDRNGDGRISGFSEISFVEDFLGAATDLEGLYAYDSDRDGFLTPADARFADFQIWIDGNSNGHSEAKELFLLADLAIVSLGLEALERAPWEGGEYSDQIVGVSIFERTDGSTGSLADVAFTIWDRDISAAHAVSSKQDTLAIEEHPVA